MSLVGVVCGGGGCGKKVLWQPFRSWLNVDVAVGDGVVVVVVVVDVVVVLVVGVVLEVVIVLIVVVVVVKKGLVAPLRAGFDVVVYVLLMVAAVGVVFDVLVVFVVDVVLEVVIGLTVVVVGLQEWGGAFRSGVVWWVSMWLRRVFAV